MQHPLTSTVKSPLPSLYWLVVTPNPEPPKAAPNKLIANPIVEKAIRGELNKPKGELTEADLEKVTRLHLSGNQLTDVKGLEKLTLLRVLRLNGNKLTDVRELAKLTQLRHLFLQNNPALTLAQIDELQGAMPKCLIYNNPKK